MATALLDGFAIFGTSVEVEGPGVPERREQLNAYPGVNGLESLDMGDNGLMTTITGRLWGATPGDLAAAVATIGNFYDGLPHTLVDTDGTTWTNVVLIGFQRLPKKSVDPENGCTQRYAATFRHLTTS